MPAYAARHHPANSDIGLTPRAQAIHQDPFDRLLVAQARAEPMILLTDDEALGGYGEFLSR